MPNNDRFKTINNGIDVNLPIIVDNPVGFYNITKIRNIVVYKLVEDGKIKDSTDYKKIRRYFSSVTNQQFIDEIKNYLKIDNVKYDLKDEISFDFHGTYVHKKLFEHMCMWIDINYYMRVTNIIDFYHNSANKDLLNQKDDKIDELTSEIKKLTSKFDESLAINKEMRTDIKEIKCTMQELLYICKKFLQVHYRSLYSINDITKQTKVLIAFVHVKYGFNNKTEYKYIITLRYCQLSEFTNSYNNVVARTESNDY